MNSVHSYCARWVRRMTRYKAYMDYFYSIRLIIQSQTELHCFNGSGVQHVGGCHSSTTHTYYAKLGTNTWAHFHNSELGCIPDTMSAMSVLCI